MREQLDVQTSNDHSHLSVLSASRLPVFCGLNRAQFRKHGMRGIYPRSPEPPLRENSRSDNTAVDPLRIRVVRNPRTESIARYDKMGPLNSITYETLPAVAHVEADRLDVGDQTIRYVIRLI